MRRTFSDLGAGKLVSLTERKCLISKVSLARTWEEAWDVYQDTDD